MGLLLLPSLLQWCLPLLLRVLRTTHSTALLSKATLRLSRHLTPQDLPCRASLITMTMTTDGARKRNKLPTMNLTMAALVEPRPRSWPRSSLEPWVLPDQYLLRAARLCLRRRRRQALPQSPSLVYHLLLLVLPPLSPQVLHRRRLRLRLRPREPRKRRPQVLLLRRRRPPHPQVPMRRLLQGRRRRRRCLPPGRQTHLPEAAGLPAC